MTDPNATLEPIAHRFIAALHALERDEAECLDDMVDLFAADAELVNAMLKLVDARYHGHDGVRAFWRDYQRTLGRARSDFYRITYADDAIGLFWTTTGINGDGAGEAKKGEQAVEYDGASLLIVNGEGLIQEFRGYYDTRELDLTAAGQG